jgi:signal transduction histidine kinase
LHPSTSFAQAPAASFGLRYMTERVRALGGTLRVSSPTGGGVVIEVRTPTADAAPRAPAAGHARRRA